MKPALPCCDCETLRPADARSFAVWICPKCHTQYVDELCYLQCRSHREQEGLREAIKTEWVRACRNMPSPTHYSGRVFRAIESSSDSAS